jgi:hypothetical protein
MEQHHRGSRPPGHLVPLPRPADGVTSVTETADGHVIERTLGTDGSATHRDAAPDGSWTLTTDDGRGTTTDGYGAADGSHSVTTNHADGTYDYVHDDGSGATVLVHRAPDGTFTQSYRRADGSWYSIADHPDGSVTESDSDTVVTPVVVDLAPDLLARHVVTADGQEKTYD